MTEKQITTHDTYHPELREPLRKALNIVADIADTFEWSETSTSASSRQGVTVLDGILKDIQAKYPTCVDFERDFVSIALSIATGVGKTRLMGAIMTHLYLTGKSRNFFVLAPNLTIYDKLIKDFGDSAYAKYAFKGIAAFVQNPPVIIRGDNYASASGLFAEREMRINIFNISKFNKDSTDKTGQPRLKRISEYLGQSYWKYLTQLNDLVILMDEAHRYHADKSKKVLNELNPKFGIELTATPFVPKGGNAVADKESDKGNLFKNIVFEYSLAAALAEGKYIKEPAIATRENFIKEGKSDEEIERIKLEDAISVHEKTKVELQRYANETGRKEVKPFILVVCKDTTHAREVYEYVTSKQFYNGSYSEKTLQIDSTTRTTEDIEKQFVSLENPTNPIEIVIHVNMLKEGWDVSNLYTIVPLRAAKALTLIEQTIGRGLRLPYGERTGDKDLDTLTVVSHEHFDQVIAASKDQSSIFRQMQFVKIDPSVVGEKTVLQIIPDKISARQQQQQEQITTLQNAYDKQKAQTLLDAEKAIMTILPMVAEALPQVVKTMQDVLKPEAEKKAMEILKTHLDTQPKDMFSAQTHLSILQEAAQIYKQVVVDVSKNSIEIPRLVLTPAPPKEIFDDFDLDISGQNGVETKFEFHIGNEQVLRQDLVKHQMDRIILMRGAREQRPQTPMQRLINALLDYREINYDKWATLLVKLSQQALKAIHTALRPDEDMEDVVKENLREIARRIYVQMKKHFRVEAAGYALSAISPFSRIEKHNITIPIGAGRLDFAHSVVKPSDIKKLVFIGFKKAAHAEYKFDSNSELNFARLLERDPSVLKWLRPAPRQFDIYWGQQLSKKYEPDFVVETAEAKYLIEVKAANEIDTTEVQQKAEAAQTFCQAVSDWAMENNLKKWHYVLIPHDVIQSNSTFEGVRDR